MDGVVPALVPAVLAGVACLLAARSPRAGLHRIATPPSRVPAQGGGAVVRVARGRPDAPSPARRVGLGAGAGAGACLVCSRLLDVGWWPFLGWPVVLAAAALLLGGLEPRSAQARARRLVADVPQALELMADGLAAGLPLRGACATVVDAFDGPVAEELGAVLRAVELGVGDAAAWSGLVGHPQLGAAAADLARAAESGTELVAALRHHAATAREQRRAALQQRARSVGVRSVLPLMTCFIPAFLLLGVVPTVVSAVVQAFG
ncbi:Type II secretion system (T2SS), protein F [Friedmanniella luteola]|uniref:Type II secretion system (T2SS), protein F n=1 Tax=Friedmanniella luteola TaxID=546871 RepID=A0A1H1LGI6_9ACTN|nr:type II secretion system F family protein [Friedmanniella luteola]SDR73626.1 Type II secretion system (T2SS), protein F [Friedmanniella luteola]